MSNEMASKIAAHICIGKHYKHSKMFMNHAVSKSVKSLRHGLKNIEFFRSFVKKYLIEQGELGDQVS